MVVLVLVLDRIQPILRGNRVGLRRTSLLYPLRKPSPSPRRVPVPFPRHDRRPDPKHGFKKISSLNTSRMERVEGEKKLWRKVGIDDFSWLLVFFFFSWWKYLETFVKFNRLKEVKGYFFFFFFRTMLLARKSKEWILLLLTDVKETGLNRFR